MMNTTQAPDFIFMLKFPEQNFGCVSSSMIKLKDQLYMVARKEEYKGSHFLIYEMGKPLLSGTISTGGEIKLIL